MVVWPLPGPDAKPWPVSPSWVVVDPCPVTPGSKAMARNKEASI
jgi:hypothetical protein